MVEGFLVAVSLALNDDCLTGPLVGELDLAESLLGVTELAEGGLIGCLFLFGVDDVLSSGLEMFSLLLFTFLVELAVTC